MIVQCISDNNGLHKRLQIGKSYLAEYYIDQRYYIIKGIDRKEHPLDKDYGLYLKTLFKPIDIKRNEILNEILNEVGK